MTDLFVFPDVGDLVRQVITQPDAVAHLRIPTPRPARFYRVIRTGGVAGRNNITDQAQITVESWGTDEDDAIDLAQQARARMHQARATVVDGTPIYRVDELAGPAWQPDPDSDQPRFVQTFVVAARGAKA